MADSITFTHGGATFTVHPATIRSGIRRDYLLHTLRAVGDPVARYQFAQVVAQTSFEGDLAWLGWQPPEPGASAEAVTAAFEVWLDLPGELGDTWRTALAQVNAPTAPEELQPEVSEDADPE